jgi:hypothetical protein
MSKVSSVVWDRYVIKSNEPMKPALESPNQLNAYL